MISLSSLLLLILLASCSKEALSPAAPSSPEGIPVRKAIAILEKTTSYAPSVVYQAAAASLSKGAALSVYSAERCWQAEKNRPEISLACALAWSIGRERSSLLEKGVAELASRNRAAALAAVRAEFPLDRIGLGDLRSMLGVLAADPGWLRAQAVLIWLRTHPVPPISEADELAKLLHSTPLTAPADFRLVYQALHQVKPAAAAAIAEEHCGPLISGDLQVRCWRFLSAFLDTRSSSLPPELRPRLPPKDRAWQLFRLGMPARARLFNH